MFETIKIGGFWAHLPCAEGTFCPKMALEIWLDQDGPATCHSVLWRSGWLALKVPPLLVRSRLCHACNKSGPVCVLALTHYHYFKIRKYDK